MSTELIETFPSRLEVIQEELLAIPGMLDASAFTMGKASKREIIALESHIKFSIPSFLREFYVKVGSYCIEWKYQNPGNSLHKAFGLCFIYSLDQMLNHLDPRINLQDSPKYENLLWNLGDPPEIIEQLQGFFILDDLKYDNFVLIRFEDEALYLYTRPYSLRKLSVNFEQYIDLTLKTRGTYLWQQYVVDDTDNSPLLPDAFHENMKRLFPEEDFSNFSVQNKKYYNYEFKLFINHKKYAYRFEEMVDELRRHDEIEQVKFRMNRINLGAHPADFHRAFMALGFQLPEPIIQFYQEVNGLTLSWKKRDKDSRSADFVLLSLDDMFAGYNVNGLDWALRRPWNYTADCLYREYGIDDSDLIGLEHYRLLYREERINVLISFNQDRDYKLMLVYDFDRYALTISFEQFIEYLLMFRGAKYWQLLFTSSDPYSELGLPENYMEEIRFIFPNVKL